MITLFERTFDVRASLTAAWDHLAQVERWPSWAQHIRRAELYPPGALCPESRGHLVLSNGIRSSFVMEEFEPRRRCAWRERLLWLDVKYDHLFEALPGGGTRLRFRIDAEGPGVRMGPVFARLYAGNFDAAILLLVHELGGPPVGPGERAVLTRKKGMRRSDAGAIKG